MGLFWLSKIDLKQPVRTAEELTFMTWEFETSKAGRRKNFWCC